MIPVIIALVITAYFFLTNIINFIYLLIPYYTIFTIIGILLIPLLLLIDKGIIGIHILKAFLWHLVNLLVVIFHNIFDTIKSPMTVKEMIEYYLLN